MSEELGVTSEKTGFMKHMRRLFRLAIAGVAFVIVTRGLFFLMGHQATKEVVFGVLFAGVLAALSVFSYLNARAKESRRFSIIANILLIFALSLLAFALFGGVNGVILTAVLGINGGAFILWIAMILPQQYMGAEAE